MDRYTPAPEASPYNNRLTAGAMARSADGNPGTRLGQEHRSFLSNARARTRIYLEPRDAWVGVYVANNAVYVCPFPFLVFRWVRKP